VLRNGLSWLTAILQQQAAVSVTYRRGSDETAGITAIVGRTEFEATDDEGGVLRSQSRDYLIAPADLVIDGSQTLPNVGDKILETVGSETHLYEVLTLGVEGHWRWSDPFRTLMRIHTRQVEVQSG